MKFLKREKKETLDELDLPPAPPSLEGFEDNMPELPDFPDFGEEKISAPKEDMADFNFPEEEQNAPESKENTMDFPSFPETEEEPMPPIEPIKAPFTIPQEIPPMPEQEPERESVYEERPAEEEHETEPQETYPKAAGRLFSHEKRVLRERPSAKTIYVSVDNFKATLGSISMIRGNLKKSEEALMKMESIKNAKDKSFDRMKSSLEDLQRKLIFVDKTLFKEGE
ncbi:hypothetical protein HYX05_00645 [Candidatus Woesearchaeota archaeon]|nr:hypothetical protein [Candidatus Woesearchaeota archaeon]